MGKNNSPKAVKPCLTWFPNCFIIFDLGAVPHDGLESCHKPPKILGTVDEPNWKVSMLGSEEALSEIEPMTSA